MSPKADNKRVKTDPGTSQGSENAEGKESCPEVKHSRSGRMLKRSSFHDEIEEGEQHLRVAPSDQCRKQKKQQKQIEKPQKSKTTVAPVVEVAIKDEEEEDEKLDVESLESVGPARPFRAIVAANTQTRPQTILPLVPAESVATPDEDSLGSQVTDGGKPTAASPVPLSETEVLPDIEDSNPTASSLVDQDAKSDNGDTAKTDPTPAKVAKAPSVASISTSVTAEPTTTTTTPSDPMRDVATASGQPKEAGTAKVPRRKPGARECMQISRRFGVRVIPDKYMVSLLEFAE